MLRELLRAVLAPPAGATTAPRHRLLARLFGYRPGKPTRETAWLDGVRGVAATLVMIYHVNMAWYPFTLEAPFGAIEGNRQAWRLPFLRNLMCSGHAQVSLFFVLSGMVLAWGPLVSIREGRADKFATSVSSSAFRRWIRLFVPCFLVALVPMLEVWLGLVEIPNTERRGNLVAQLWHFARACERFANPFSLERTPLDAVHGYAWMFWTIPFEWAGSLCVFFVLLAVSRIRDYARRALVVGFVAAYACASGYWIYWLFASGVLLADYVQHAGGFEQLDGASKPWTAFWAAVFAAGLFLAGHPEKNDAVYRLEGSVWNVFASASPQVYLQHEHGIRFWWSWSGLFVIWGACHIRVVRRFFELSFVRYLGQISYMLYLTHAIVEHWLGGALRSGVFRLLGTKVGEGQYVIENGAVFLLAYILVWSIEAPCAFWVAHLAEVFIDEPSIRLAKWVDQKFVNGFLVDDKPESEELALV